MNYIDQDQIKPLVGFNLSLDLSKVAKGAKPKDKILVEEAKAPQFDHDFALRSSLGNNSEMAHPIDVSYKANDAHVPSDSSSSSDDYDFVPPPELNPNLYYPERKQQPVVGKVGLSLGGLNFKLNLTNVPTAHIITDEDKSRIQALKESKPDTFSNTVNLKLSEENPSKENLKFDGSSTTTKAITAPKLPAFGGGFKLDLTKVPTAHVITDEDKQKWKANKDIPLIAKNNFTDSKEIKGSRPKKLNVKGKDSIINTIEFSIFNNKYEFFSILCKDVVIWRFLSTTPWKYWTPIGWTYDQNGVCKIRPTWIIAWKHWLRTREWRRGNASRNRRTSNSSSH